MNNIKEIYVEPGYYFPPGVYIDFWENKIEKVFSESVKNTHVKLKPLREMWVGSLIAAAHTKNTGIKHYVALPFDEPPDVLIAKLSPEEMKSGKVGTKIESLRVEITRCSLRDSEDLITHIQKKNKRAYSGMTLAVYMYGDYQSFDMNKLRKEIMALGNIYVEEIIVLCRVHNMLGVDLLKGTYSQIFLHPVLAHSEFNINDDTIFFRDPGILTANKRGVSTDLTSVGRFRIMAPDI